MKTIKGRKKEDPDLESGVGILSRKSGALRVEAVTDYETFLQLRQAWGRLEKESGLDHPFLTFEWIQTWWECFGAGKELHVLLVKEKDRLRAIAPLMRSTVKRYGIPVQRLGFLYNPHTPRCDFLAAKGANGIWRAVWQYLRGNQDMWDVLELCQLPPESEALPEIRNQAGSDEFLSGTWGGEKSPYLPIGTRNGYPEGPSRKEEKRLRNCFNRVRRLGEPELEIIPGGENMGKALEDGFQIEAAAWKGKAGTAISSDPAVCLFYRKLAERAAGKGWLRLHFLSVAQRRIAFGYSLCYRGKLYLLKPGYDPAYASCSPSMLLVSLTLRNALAEGIEEYDMLGTDDEWKLKWTNKLRPHTWLFVYPRTPRGVLLHRLKFGLIPRIREFVSRIAFTTGRGSSGPPN
ncbi:MAG: GNAT family N-acetyltransferase [Candidatus Tectomicrobia bacterium]|uniref:GNAT family N-acetyltransferase n=1 Tax=Tectimicrobiota bacterium TaxID=2528274 RepID=A0A932I1R5_UNCTE|nr:GNAT family N-acetyltransferase [Candidatus Tectomicrobia bacterium]